MVDQPLVRRRAHAIARSVYGSADVRTWLLTDATKMEWADFLDGLSRRLIAAGVPVDRAWSGRLFLNPLVAGDSHTWYVDGSSKRTVLPFSNRAVAAPAAGPMRRIFEERVVHQPLGGVSREQFDLPRELFDEGYTDFVGLGAEWAPAHADTAVARVAMTLATKAPGGFSAEAIATLDTLLDTLRIVIRLVETERLASGLLGTYLGAHAAARVLDGQVRRGDGETVRAALWFSDLRGFTTLSDRLSRPQLLAMLDDAFEAQGAAIHAHGGEILKFIGDGLLAVFRGEPEESCRRALRAAAQFEASVLDVNARAHRKFKRPAPRCRWTADAPLPPTSKCARSRIGCRCPGHCVDSPSSNRFGRSAAGHYQHPRVLRKVRTVVLLLLTTALCAVGCGGTDSPSPRRLVHRVRRARQVRQAHQVTEGERAR